MRYRKSSGTLECRFQLLIYPENILPAEITRILGIQPTLANFKGEQVTNSHGNVRSTPNHIWAIISDQVVDSDSLEVHFDWFLDRVLPAKDGLKKLRAMADVQIFCRLTWWTKDSGLIFLSLDQMQKLVELELSLEIEVAAYPDEVVETT